MKDVSDIYRIATRNLTRGQDVYAEEFVRSVNDPRINTELARTHQ